MDKTLFTRAVAIRDEVNEAANTHERVGGLFVSILEVLAQTLTAENITWKESATEVNLRFSIPSTVGGSDTVVDIPIPRVNDTTAGVITPAQVAEIRQAAADLVKKEKDERRSAIENLQTTLASVIQTANAANTTATEAKAAATEAAANASRALSESSAAKESSASALAKAEEASTVATAATGKADAAVASADEAKKDAAAAVTSASQSAKQLAREATSHVYPIGLISSFPVTIEKRSVVIMTEMEPPTWSTVHHCFYITYEMKNYSVWNNVPNLPDSSEYTADVPRLFYNVWDHLLYRLASNELVPVGSDLKLGESATEAFPGDRGKTLEERMDNMNIPSIYNVTQEQPLSEGLYYTLASATVATWNRGKAADGLIISFAINAKQWKTYQFIGKLTGEDTEQKAIFTAASNWQDFGSLSAGTEPMVNINNLAGEPDAGAYYTLSTAIAKLLAYQTTSQVKYAKPGLIISYRTAPTEMECKQFCGTQDMVDGTDAEGRTFGTLEMWRDFGGGGKVAAIFLGETQLQPDTKGNITIPVDNSLSTESDNLLPNAVVTTAINEMKANTLFSADTNENGAETEVTLRNQDGNEICSFSVPRGGGSSSDTGRGSISVSAALDKQVLKLGDSLRLTYSYDHLTDGQTDGTTANLAISAKIGTATVFQTTLKDVKPGTTETIDLTEYVQAGTIEVYVIPTVTFSDGTVQSKRAYAKATAKDFNITTDHLMGEGLHNGGYLDGETISFNIRVTGSGTRKVRMYLDGATEPIEQAAAGGTVTKSFQIPASSLSAGRHVVQFVAECDGLLSDSIYCHFLKAGADAPFVGVMYTDKSGNILTGEAAQKPVLTAKQYEELKFSFAAYNPLMEVTPVTETIIPSVGAQTKRTLSVKRTQIAYSTRFRTQGQTKLSLACGVAAVDMTVNVESSGVELEEYAANLAMKLSSAGRSNDEQPDERASWDYGEDIHTTFENFDWTTNGWMSDEDGEALKLTNGAKAIIGFQPFASDAKVTGMTVEMELKVSNVSERNGVLISCMEQLAGGAERGFKVTGQSAAFYTGGSTVQIDDENLDSDGQPIKTTVPIGVDSNFTSDTRMRVTFVLGKTSDPAKRYIELYINGTRERAMSYLVTDVLRQDVPQNITLSSDTADLYVYSVHCYTTSLSDDAVVDNHIVCRPDTSKMFALYDENNVIGETGEPSMRTLIARGKSVVHFVRSADSGTGLDDVMACVNKKQDFACDHVFIYTPWGWVFRIDHCKVRIQGTSSTKYPVKNLRIYCAKSATGEKVQICVDKGDGKGFVEWEGGLSIPLFEGDGHSVKVVCMKADFSDSSMTTNTGVAKLVNDIFKELAPTPAQKLDNSLRSCINGWPCDLFASTSVDDANPHYCGQYNFNHDKSDWAEVTGMKIKGEGIDEDRKMALEFLNNMTKLGNWQVDADIDAQMDSEFDDALEFNYPKDTFWSSADTEKGEAIASDTHKQDIKRLWQWVKACVPAGADTKEYKNLASFKSEKFRNELPQYFNVANICLWYILTDYNAMVDQRVKNMIMRTWDGLVWYFTYYDGDCQLGKRNDSMLKYLYNMSRETWDAEKSKYAFEGHDSVLWCLLLANCQDWLGTYAEKLRRLLTTERLKKMLNEEQMGNWCGRIYNRSGEMKYIIPETVGTKVNRNGVVTMEKAYYMYAENGTSLMHRNHFIDNRYSLLDAKWGLPSWTADMIDAYLTRQASQAASRIVITSADEYYFGWGTNNNAKLQTSDRIMEGETCELSISRALTVNDPIRIYGASRIRGLDLTGASSVLSGTINLNQCRALRVLDAHVPSGGKGSASAWNFSLSSCAQLRTVNVHGQSQASTAGTNGAMDLSGQPLLTSLDAGGTNLQSVTLAKGAPITSLTLPATLTTISLQYLQQLEDKGLTLEGTEAVTQLIVDNCPKINWKALLSRCPNVKTLRVAADSAEGDGTELLRLVSEGVGGIDDQGAAVGRPVMQMTYNLSLIREQEDIDLITKSITGITVVLALAAYINLVDDELNCESMSDEPEVDTVTMDNIASHLQYFNGETYEEFTKHYREENMDINDLIKL